MSDYPGPPEKPFENFSPTEADPWDVQRVGHLLRRTCFGATWDKQEAMLKQSPADAVKSVLDYDTEKDPFEGMLEQLQGLFNLSNGPSVAQWWIHRMLYTPQPMQEMIALFWHNHFATSASKVGDGQRMHNQIELFRRKGLNSFRELLIAVGRDPAMLQWLDGHNSRKGNPNENYAREVMELFTLGVGNYTEQDVKELARAFTGWQISGSEGKLNKSLFDDGEKTILGQTGKFNDEQAVDLLLGQPAAPKFIARKLLRAFVHPSPTDEQIEHYASRLLEHKWQIKPVLSELLSSRVFYSDWAYRAKIKNPMQIVVGAALAVGGKANTSFLREQAARMGQSLCYPPNVKGWDGEEIWINSNTVLARFNFGMEIATQRQQQMAVRSELDKWLRDRQVKTADDVIDLYGRIFLDGNVPAPAREKLLKYMNQDEKGNENDFALSGGTINSKVRGIIHILMTTPEFQLA